MNTIEKNSISGREWKGTGDKTHGTDNLIPRILANRGVTDVETFLNPSIKKQMPDPFVLSGIENAARIVCAAVAAGRKIAVFGDYDVDGITSTAILVKYFKSIDVDVLWRLPSREEGYGLSVAAVEELHAAGAEILISVDCGISSAREVRRAHELGMQIVITDHHSPDSEIPDADAVVDPKLNGDTSGLDYLAGVGVAFMFLVAVNRELRLQSTGHKAQSIDLMDYMDLVALGTICDTMPLIRLNRAFVATGLKVLAQGKNLGLKILMEIAGAKNVSVYTAGFVIGPRLNAAGRLATATPALELLLTDNPLIARDLAEKLDAQNARRKDIENGILLRATEMAEECCRSGKSSIFLCGEDWHGGVMGIIAGRLKDRYHLPTCIATKSNGVINGSGRGIAGVDLGAIIHDALSAGILTEGGGHAAAAGFSLNEAKAGEFCEFLEREVLRQFNGVPPVRQMIVDAEMDVGGANMSLVRELSALAPFGQGNPEPTLVLNGGALAWSAAMGGNHLRGSLRTAADTQLQFVGFNLANTPVGAFLLDDTNLGRQVRLCGKLKENDFNGRVSAQFVVEDVAI